MTLKLYDGVFTADTEYGTALLDEDSGRYWNLNPTGALILRTLLAGGTIAQAAEELAEQYVVDADTATRDVQELIDELRSAGLVEHEALTGSPLNDVRPKRSMP
jgi:Coenzyme PQQ synthesis protein D (PqqD)